ncbi:recombination regulator RecX [Geomonas subterranea]|uniref:Regulatory protein RecX n=1 Tax=Geomonas subterranea TaxID=2847989 RepID=A0ABX8LGI3_9BACT|nr:regulatory protein RecX [Geomonas subterranea]QXE90446.1 recombination regulator RecX [Geomonas subterranea]QXM11478.1 recombination regulator RecX [Geomonas subterranea]
MQRGTAFDCCLRILTLRDHSEGELRKKLSAKGYQEPEIEASVARVKELGYLDDLRFARSYASSALRNGKGVGPRLKLELSRRGVAGAIVNQVLDELAQEYSEAGLLAQLMERRYPGFDAATASDKEKRRIVGYLQRKGFSLSAIFRELKAHED